MGPRDWENALIGPTGLRIDEWRRDGSLTVVKTGPHRVVYRVELPQGAIYIKHFLVPGLRSKIRQWIRRGKGRNEGRRSRYLSAIGVPTITPIALGEQRKHKFLLENYLITHAITESVPLDEFVEDRLPAWPEPTRSHVRQELANALALLTARLHDAGYVHQDFHPGNVLVRIESGDRPSLAMIDLDALRVSFPLGWPEAQHNLALLNHYFWLRSNRADRRRFLKAYLDARQAICRRPDPRRLSRDIEEATRAWAERLWRRWGRRCRGNNKYFRTFSSNQGQAVAVSDLDPDEVNRLLADPDAPFDEPGSVLLKDSRTTTVAETELKFGGVSRRVIYKRFNQRTWYEPFLTYFRPSPAWQSWQAGQHLASRAIPTPRNLLYIGRRCSTGRCPFWYLPHETYLVTLKEEGAMTLHDYVTRTLPTFSFQRRREEIDRLTRALARLLRTMHERSLSNRDLKASNILVVANSETHGAGLTSEEDLRSGWRLTLIDLHGVRLVHPLPSHRRIQNLARLALSLSGVVGRTRTDALRFLRAYLPWGLSPRNDWKKLWRTVAERGRVKTARNLRHGRKLS